MLDVNWLTPAKRRQLVVVGEEGMFELDYLTQRLTFTRATDTTNPRLIGGYAPTFEGEVVELPVAIGRAARRRARRVPRRRPRRRPARSSTPRTACGPSRSPRRCSTPRRDGAADRPVRPVLEVRTRMTIVSRPPGGPEPARRLDRAADARLRATSRRARSRRGPASPGRPGTVAVVGAGKMGLPLAAQFARHGWHGDRGRRPAGASSTRSTRAESHVGEEPGLAELVADGPCRRPPPGDDRRRRRPRASADVVVLIVPVMLDDEQQPDYRYMDAAVDAIAPGRPRRARSVIFETTLPVGDTRGRFAPRLEAASGLTADEDLFVAFSPERLYSGAALRNLATYPKLVGGIGPASTARAAAFYDAVLDTEIVAMSSAEAAEFSKLADTTYRDVNIALANEFARYAERVGVDVHEVIAAANSQPYSHIHQPGLGVGGHCIPVYPHFLLSRAPELELVELSRRTNDGQVGVAIRALQQELGGLGGRAGPRPRADVPPRASRSWRTRGRCR